MDKSDIPFLSATELSRLIGTKEVSPVEATQAYLDRIDDVDFKFNAYLRVCREQALSDARASEEAIARGNYLGPMHGIPVAVKDQFWSKDIRTTGGSRILTDFVPDEDATVIANLKKAGAILLGKTNLTEFAIGGGGQRFRTSRNPWNLDMHTGGSSAGSGAATAAYLCAASLGEDTAGSIRIPASFCGLVGLRPSWGRVSRYGVLRGVWSMDAVGPMTRTVEDAAITLGAIAGHDPSDPYTSTTPVPDYQGALAGSLRGLRVGVVKEQMESDATDPEVREAVARATAVLGELGAYVEEVSIPLSVHAPIITMVALHVESAATHGEWVRERLHDYGFTNRTGLLTGSLMPARAYYKAQKLRELIRRQVLETLDAYDVLVDPTLGKVAQPIDSYDSQPLLRRRFSYTMLANLVSAPAVSVPCGLSAEGLPIGLQISGRPGADETVLKVAHAYEQATQWHTMRPPTV